MCFFLASSYEAVFDFQMLQTIRERDSHVINMLRGVEFVRYQTEEKLFVELK